MQRIAKYLKERNIPKDSLEANSILEGYELGVESTKREMIEKAAEWLSNNMFHSINHGVQINGLCVSDFVGRFKKAMQDESK